LIVTTGGLLSFYKTEILIFGNQFSSGGIVGLPLNSFLTKYSNATGAAIILSLLWLIGFILSTGFSLISFYKRIYGALKVLMDRAATLVIKWKERKQKAKKRKKRIKAEKKKEERQIKIQTLQPKPIKKIPMPKQEVFTFMQKKDAYQLPSINFLDEPDPSASEI